MINLSLDQYLVSKHAQLIMKDIGITYALAVPQSISDAWWFFGCRSIPYPLPSYLSIIPTEIEELVGYGLDALDVKMLRRRDRSINVGINYGYDKSGMDFTCDNCRARRTCPSAYDLYNVDGDCLEDK